MTELELWAAIAVVVTVLVTGYAAIKESKIGGQTVLDSLLEVWTNIAIGFGINYVANLWILPMADFHVSYSQAFLIGTIFTAISIVRSFMIRRWYNRKMIKKLRR